MKIEMNVSEIWDLLKQGSTNQRKFIESLKYSEFEKFIEYVEEFHEELDLRGNINGGVLWAEEDPIQKYIVWRNDRIAICWI